MPETILQTICDLRLRLSGLGAVLDAADESMMKAVDCCNEDSIKTQNLLIVALSELERAHAALDNLEIVVNSSDN